MNNHEWAGFEEALNKLERRAYADGYDRAVAIMETTGNTTAARILREQWDGRIV